jgi:hypothetical protein
MASMAADSPDHPASGPFRHKWDEQVQCVDSLWRASQTGVVMIDHFAPEFRRWLGPLPRWLAPLFGGFLYWLVFLLVLEPDNVLRASQAGYALPLGREAIRIAGAAALGTAVTPLLTWLAGRIPMGGAQLWRHAAIHLIVNACVALLLIISSCFLAAWGFERQVAPSLDEVRVQLAANWTLLVFALCAFTAIAQLVRSIRCTHEVRSVVADSKIARTERAERIAIKTAGRLRFVEQVSIDWLETQGNYLALHMGSNVQLVRRTLTDFETELDADRFVRIHRRMIVAIDRIKEMKPLPNGDAMLQLHDGHELRMSRRYRDAVVRGWGGGKLAD